MRLIRIGGQWIRPDAVSLVKEVRPGSEWSAVLIAGKWTEIKEPAIAVADKVNEALRGRRAAASCPPDCDYDPGTDGQHRHNGALS